MVQAPLESSGTGTSNTRGLFFVATSIQELVSKTMVHSPCPYSKGARSCQPLSFNNRTNFSNGVISASWRRYYPGWDGAWLDHAVKRGDDMARVCSSKRSGISCPYTKDPQGSNL